MHTGSTSSSGCSSYVVSPSSETSQPRLDSLLSVQRSVSSPDQPQVKARYLQLIKWKDEQGETQKFFLMEKIQNKWRDIGQLVEISHSQLEAISTQHRDNPLECCRDVLGKWLENPPHDYPATWDGLIELLGDCKLASVVNELKTALSKANLSYSV